MLRFLSFVFVIFLLNSVSYTSGYKWITLRYTDSIPPSAIRLGDDPIRYVGRAIHYNLVLPAEVYNSTYARLSYENKVYIKQQFEVLTDTEKCEWKTLNLIKDIPQNAVRGGTGWKYEPIFIGMSMGKYDSHIASIYISSDRFESLEDFNNRFVLTCKDMNTWIDASSENVPKNAVPLRSHWENTQYIGRLPSRYSWVPATVDTYKNNTRAHYEYNIESFYCQILVGNKRDYEWALVTNGKIPDYAVVAGQSEHGEMRYVVREDDNLSVRYRRFSDLFYQKYNILVKNGSSIYY